MKLVETRQITKNVARILDQYFNVNYDENNKLIRDVNIITLKSSLTSQFRKKFKLHKVRDLNDLHHAHDAYLNIVVAKTLMNKYPNLKSEFVYGEFMHTNVIKSLMNKDKDKATQKVKFYSNIMKFFDDEEIHTNVDGEIVWFKNEHIKMIKNILQQKNFNVVMKTEIQNDQFFNETLKPKSNDKLVSIKQGLDTTKYGGYSNVKETYSVLVVGEVKHKDKWKKVKKIVGIPLLDKVKFEKNPIQYLEELGYRNINKGAFKKIPRYTLIVADNGLKRLLASSKEFQKGNQFYLPEYLVSVLYYAQKAVEHKNLDAISYLEEHRNRLFEIIDYVKEYAELIEEQSNMTKVLNILEDNNTVDIIEFAQSVLNLLLLTSFGATADFKFFGKSIARRRLMMSDRFLNGNVKIVYQSVTGLYETEIDLGEL